jgi:NodT family efflux transporter outer membrane factor (OMF) lipoprotein
MTMRQRSLRAVLLACCAALAPALAACDLESGDEQPQTSAPASFTARASNAAAVWPARDWTHGFGAPELDALVAEAESANLDIAAAAARIDQADAQVRVNVGQVLIPTLDFTTDVTRQRQGSSTTTNSGASAPRNFTRNQFSAALNASYEIDFWGRNRATVRASRALALASRYDQQTVAIGVVAGVANGYFTIVALQDRIRIADENLANASHVLDAIRARLQVGTATALDVAQQETVVAQQRAVVPGLRQQLRQQVNAIAILLGRAPEGFNVQGGTLSQLSLPLIEPGLPSELLRRRPDIGAAEANLAAADADVVFARANMFPAITLTASGGYQSVQLSQLFIPGSGFWTLGAGLTQPILQYYSLQGALDQNRARYRELLDNYRKAVISSFSDVENALVAVQETAEQQRLQEIVVTSARRAYEITQARLREGTVDLVTVLNTEQALFQAEDARIQAALARLQAAVALFQALGGGYNNQTVAQSPAAAPRAP